MKAAWTRALVTLIALVSTSLAHASERPVSPGSTVTIPVQEYMTLIRNSEKPRFVSILGASLSGRYGEKLRVEVSGQASSLNEQREFLRFDAQNVNFETCSGDAQVSFSEGVASLLPTASKFSLACQISIKNWSQVQLTFVQAMGAKADVSGAETLILSEGNGDRSINISKALGGERPAENLPVSAVGRFRISVLPEASRFEYNVQIENPSRNTRRFDINLVNGETPSRVSTESEFTEDAGKISIKLRPGSNSVRVEGAFTGASFKSPVSGGPHYLLIENHQLLQLTAESKSRRISARDAGMSSRFSGQRAYLLQDESGTTWTVKKLAVLPALGYAIENAQYNYFIPSRGKGLVEATFQINNQGQPEIPLPLNGRPLYLEIDGAPQVLASNADGELLLQVAPGNRRVYLQYEAPVETSSILGLPMLKLARPKAVMSEVSSRIGFEDGALLLWAQGLGRVESDLWDLFSLVLFFVVLVAVYSWTRRFGMSSLSRAAASASAALIAVLYSTLFSWVVIAGLIALAVRHREDLMRRFASIRWSPVRLIGAFAGFVLVAFVLTLALSMGRRFDAQQSENLVGGIAQKKMQSYDRAAGGAPAAAPMLAKGRGSIGAAESAAADDPEMEHLEQDGAVSGGTEDYQGLPARVTVPNANRNIWFHRGLLESETPVYVFAAFLHPGIGLFLALAGMIFLLALGWTRRNQLTAWMRLKA